MVISMYGTRIPISDDGDIGDCSNLYQFNLAMEGIKLDLKLGTSTPYERIYNNPPVDRNSPYFFGIGGF